MRGLISLLFLLYFFVTVAASSRVSKRSEVLTNLEDAGFCRSYKFGVDIAKDTLYLSGLDGGLIEADTNATHNYLVHLDLSESFSLKDGTKYKMSLIDYSVPKLKDQALWSNRDNTTLYSYGGRGADGASVRMAEDNGVWTYTVADKKWQLQQTSIHPVRLVGGTTVNVPGLQAAYWVGGYQSAGTTPSITNQNRKVFSTGMIRFNTTTGEINSLDAPFTPVQQGALEYLPLGEQGILVFIGGEVPSATDGSNLTFTPNSWDYVQVYDIAGDKWYNQTTTGSVSPRTEFCAVVQHDPTSSSYQIYTLGGANYTSQKVSSEVSYLSIPSFKWYSAAGLDKGIMSLSCQAYGKQIFSVGGRLAWADDANAGCYDMPAFLYDAQSEVIRDTFTPGLSDYSLPSSLSQDIKSSPYPSAWTNKALQNVLVADSTSSSTPTPTPSDSSSNDSTSSHAGAIAGGVVGGVAGLGIILSLLWFFLRKRRQQQKMATAEESANWTKPELPTKEVRLRELDGDAKVPAAELETYYSARHELYGDANATYELDASGHDHGLQNIA